MSIRRTASFTAALVASVALIAGSPVASANSGAAAARAIPAFTIAIPWFGSVIFISSNGVFGYTGLVQQGGG